MSPTCPSEARVPGCELIWPLSLTDQLYTWWRHQMETLSALLVLCAGNSPVTSEFPSQRPVTRSFHVFLDLRLNKGLSKQYEAGDLRRLCAHYDVIVMKMYIIDRVHSLWPEGSNRLFAHYTIPLSPLCRLVWRRWAVNMFFKYMGLCVSSLPINPLMIASIFVFHLIIIIKYKSLAIVEG